MKANTRGLSDGYGKREQAFATGVDAVWRCLRMVTELTRAQGSASGVFGKPSRGSKEMKRPRWTA